MARRRTGLRFQENKEGGRNWNVKPEDLTDYVADADNELRGMFGVKDLSDEQKERLNKAYLRVTLTQIP